jgi:hypothetical protein
LSSLPALEELLQSRTPPAVLIVGAGANSDCIPRPSNYNAFYKACTDAKRALSDADDPGAAGAATVVGGQAAVEEAELDVLMVVVEDAGHLQFLDAQTTLQRYVWAMHAQQSWHGVMGYANGIFCHTL